MSNVLQPVELQSLDPSRFEVVAIDDGSCDATPRILADWQQLLPLRSVWQNQAGLAAARDLGIFLARAPILVFLDDDDVAELDLLAIHLAAHAAHPDPMVAVLGYTAIAPEFAALLVMRHLTETGRQLFAYGVLQDGQMLDHTALWGGRSSCKRSLLVRYGIFNPDFRFGCEDVEPGWGWAATGCACCTSRAPAPL